jgi:hypothetical protein
LLISIKRTFQECARYVREQTTFLSVILRGNKYRVTSLTGHMIECAGYGHHDEALRGRKDSEEQQERE